MRADEVQIIGSELAIRWSDRTESYIPLQSLREHCPCAGCKGEVDVMGNLYKAEPKQLRAESFKVQRLNMVGGSGLNPIWQDGHSSGIYSFDYLRKLASLPAN